MNEFFEKLKGLRENLHRFKYIFKPFRRAFLKRFPYKVIFRIDEKRQRVVVVVLCMRNVILRSWNGCYFEMSRRKEQVSLFSGDRFVYGAGGRRNEEKSNYGLTGPGQLTSNSLLHTLSTLTGFEDYIENSIFLEVSESIVCDICKQFLQVQMEIETEERRAKRHKKQE